MVIIVQLLKSEELKPTTLMLLRRENSYDLITLFTVVFIPMVNLETFKDEKQVEDCDGGWSAII
jgi:hypothetical protein